MRSRAIAELKAGQHFPEDYASLRSWFGTDEACQDYLLWLRWPRGFVCPDCGTPGGTARRDGAFWCKRCRRSISVTAGTIFEGTRTPLTVWFAAAWLITSSKSGLAATTLAKTLSFGSYQTAWAMLHRFRMAMVRPNRERLEGRVEVDEVFFGGVKPGRRGRGADGKTLVLVAVELREPKGFGRCRMRVAADASAPAIWEFLTDFVAQGSTVVTDGWKSYPAAVGATWTVEATAVSSSGRTASEVLPAVHRVASLAKRWLLGTHQGAVEGDHLQSYLDEFTFRFNRRRADFRGLLFYRLLEQAVQVDPVTYQDLIVNPRKGKARGTPGPDRTSGPASLDRPPVDSFPWRLG